MERSCDRMSEKKLFDKKVAADDMSSDFPVLKPKSKPHGFGLERRSKGAGEWRFLFPVK